MKAKKRILILGAGFMQGRAIRAAQKKGWHVTAVDGNPEACCASLADRFQPIDLKEKERIAEFALRLQADEGLDGVFTCATDFSLSVAWVAARCGLPSHSVDAARAASNKAEMRRRFAAAGVPSPLFAVIPPDKHPDALDVLRAAGVDFPVVLKPVDNMGARGCCKVSSAPEFLLRLPLSAAFSRTGTVIAEEYMEGPEFSLEALVFDGSFHETGFADRHIFFPPYFIEMGHTIPSAVSGTDRDRLLAVFRDGVRALGLDYGAVKGDIKLTPRGPMVGEIAGRLSGGYMSGWTFPYSSGIDLTSAALDLCAGIRPDPASLLPVFRAVSAERAWISVPGTVRSVSGLDAARRVPFVRDVFPLKQAGDAAVFPRSNVEKCGNCIAAVPQEDASAGSYRDARQRAVSAAEEACRAVVLRLAPHHAGTEAFLFRFTPHLQETPSGGRNGTGLPEEPFPPPCFAVPFREAQGGDFPPLFASGWKTGELPLSGGACTQQVEYPAALPLFSPEYSDWQGRTMAAALSRAVEEEPALAGALRSAANHGTLTAMKYWTAFVRGGIQGLLYVFDVSGSR